MSDLPPPPGAPPPPFGAMPTPPPGPPSAPAPFGGYAQPYYGPVGKRRSIGLVVLISIVTCGIWTLVWSFQNGEELKQHTNDGLGGALHLLFAIVLSPVVMFLMAGEVEKLYVREGKQPPITTLWGLWFLLPLIGNIIWYVRIQRALNDYWTAHGAINDPSL